MPTMITEEEIDRRLQEADTNNVATLSVAMIKMINEQPSLSFFDFELRLRELGSLSYLVAVPRQFLPFGLNAVDHLDFTEAKFYLWVCLHGEEERDLLLKEYGLTAADNLTALTRCGVMAKGVPQRRVN